MIEPKEGDRIDVLFSCGAASAVALMETKLRYGNLCEIRALNNPVAEEHSDNRRFLTDVSNWLGIEIEIVSHPKYPSASAEEIWDGRNYMSGPTGAPCTMLLKREARQLYEAREGLADWLVLGFTADEKDRHENFVFSERGNVLPVLIDANLTKQDCFGIIREAGIHLPVMYALGYPNANCIGCVKSASPTYWNHVRRTFPEVFAKRAEMSRRLGVKLVKVRGQRIFLDELSADAVGRPLKSMKMPECGVFCEENLLKPKRYHADIV